MEPKNQRVGDLAGLPFERWVPKNSRERVGVCLDVVSGRPLLSLRVFFETSTGDYLPVPGKGFAISPEHIAELADAISEAKLEAIRRGLA